MYLQNRKEMIKVIQLFHNMEILGILVSFLFQIGAGLYLSTNGSKVDGSDYLITNSPLVPISNWRNVVPFQYVEILDNTTGRLRMAYNFNPSSLFPQVYFRYIQGNVSTLIKQTTVEKMRVDGFEDLKLELDINLTDGTEFLIQEPKPTHLKAIYRYITNTVMLKS